MTGTATDPADWIAAQVAAAGARMTGPIEEVHRRPWSTVLRVQTDRGPVFFKDSSPALGREPAITAFLARRRPDIVSTPLAVDAERGWMLMAGAMVETLTQTRPSPHSRRGGSIHRDGRSER